MPQTIWKREGVKYNLSQPPHLSSLRQSVCLARITFSKYLVTENKLLAIIYIKVINYSLGFTHHGWSRIAVHYQNEGLDCRRLDSHHY